MMKPTATKGLQRNDKKKKRLIETQKELLFRFARNKGFEVSPDWIFEDNGVSGF